MKMTLLEMTQDILSNLSSDEVNSISDSAESLQVATIIRQKYYDIISRGDLVSQDQIFQLDPSLSPTEPTLMFVPDGVGKIKYIKYFNSNPTGNSVTAITEDEQANAFDDITTGSSGTPAPGYQYVTMLPIEQFLDQIEKFDPSEDNVQSFTFQDTSNNHPGAFTFYYKTDWQPRYCCILSNYYVIFDSFDNTQDSTLQASKTQCFGQVIPTFQNVDTFTPDLDSKQFQLLLNEAKSLAFYELKQQPHAKAEQEAKRQWSSLQRNKSMNDKPTSFEQTPNFGRHSAYTRGPIFSWR